MDNLVLMCCPACKTDFAVEFGHVNVCPYCEHKPTEDYPFRKLDVNYGVVTMSRANYTLWTRVMELGLALNK